MIKKVRLKFIAVTMAILTTVFAISGIIAVGLINSNFKMQTNAILEMLSQTLPVPDDKNDRNDALSRLTSFTVKQSNGVATCNFDKELFTETEVLKYFNDAIDLGEPSGNFSFVYYRLILTEDGDIEFFATDRTNEYLHNQELITRFLLVLSFTLILLFIIVCVLSYLITKPIDQTLKKQTQFISDASHELKTPIAIISANADATIAENGNNGWLENIKEQTNRMKTLIDDMLSLAKMEETDIPNPHTEFCLSSLVTKSILAFDAVAFEKNKNLSIDIAPNINYYGDEESVKKVATILVDNALKYADDNGTVICKLYSENGKIIFSVFNTVDKLEEKIENKLFERFYRTEQSRNRSLGGSGLGLSIAKKICDSNKWKIHADIVEDTSLKITVNL